MTDGVRSGHKRAEEYAPGEPASAPCRLHAVCTQGASKGFQEGGKWNIVTEIFESEEAGGALQSAARGGNAFSVA